MVWTEGGVWLVAAVELVFCHGTGGAGAGRWPGGLVVLVQVFNALSGQGCGLMREEEMVRNCFSAVVQ